MKTCSHKDCQQINPQPLSNFYVDNNRKNKVYPYCKTCDRITKAKRKKEYNLEKRYGISTKERNEILINQNNSCRVCNMTIQEHFEKYKKDFSLDHNHETGQIRSLLCDPCNRAIGLMQDSANRLREAADYLDSFKDKECKIVPILKRLN